MNKVQRFVGRLKDELCIGVLFLLWCGVIALRAIYTRPPEPAWFMGLILAAVSAAGVGWVLRGINYRKHYDRWKGTKYDGS